MEREVDNDRDLQIEPAVNLEIGLVTKPETLSIYEDTDSIDKTLRILVRELLTLGLTQNEARILLYLIVRGKQNANKIGGDLHIQRTETYNYINILVDKGVVFTTYERPQTFFALTFDEVVNTLVNSKVLEMQKARVHLDTAKTLIEKLKLRFKEDHAEIGKEVYQTLGTLNTAVTRLKSIINEAIDVRILATDFGFFTLYHSAIYDFLSDQKKITNQLKIGIVTSYKNAKEQLYESFTNEQDLTVSIADILSYRTTFVLATNKNGNEELIIFVDEDHRDGKALYTNSKSITHVFRQIFDQSKRSFIPLSKSLES